MFEVIEQFTSSMYDRNTLYESVDDLRMDLSPYKVQPMKNLPSTLAV